MRLTLALLGWTLDLSLGPDSAEVEDRSRDLSGGTTGSTELAVPDTETWLGETGLEMEPPEDGRRVGFA